MLRTFRKKINKCLQYLTYTFRVRGDILRQKR